MKPSICLIALFFAACGHPSDEQMSRMLRERQPDFDRLLKMFEDDPQEMFIRPYVILGNNHLCDIPRTGPSEAMLQQVGLSRARWNEYSRLFDILGLEGGVVRNGDRIFFAVEDAGWFNKFTVKGVVYSSLPIEPVVPDLTAQYARNERPRGGGTFYKRVARNWYLFLDY